MEMLKINGVLLFMGHPLAFPFRVVACFALS